MAYHTRYTDLMIWVIFYRSDLFWSPNSSLGERQYDTLNFPYMDSVGIASIGILLIVKCVFQIILN